jgi:hypothetical protein
MRTLGCKLSDYLCHGFTHPEAPQVYVCGLTVSNERVVFAHPWENKTLRELAKVDTTSARPKSEQIRDLIFNVLILLSQYPARIQLEPLEVRRPKLKGAHLRPGLSKARFVSDMVEPRIVRPRHMILSMP